MKLFISWSGEFSKKVAECLSLWIPTIIQTVDVFYSPDDIAKGENWSSRLSHELEQSNFGLVCLTPENILAPWIHFEAGALSKVSNSRVSAIMLGVSPSDVKGPLARFQNTTFNREDFYRLFLSINSSQEIPLSQSVLEHAFHNSWPNLEHDITSILKEYTSRSPASISERPVQNKHDSNSEAIQEILSIVRILGNNSNVPLQSPQKATADIIDRLRPPNHALVYVACSSSSADNVLKIIRKYCYVSMKHIAALRAALFEKEICAVTIGYDQFSNFEEALNKVGASISYPRFDCTGALYRSEGVLHTTGVLL